MRELFIKNNIRQSKYWADYFTYHGSKVVWTSTRKILVVAGIGSLKVAKMQRPSGLNQEELEEVFEICRKEKVQILKLEPNIDQDITLLEKDFSISKNPLIPTATIIHDLNKDLKDIEKDFTTSARYSINRARREGYTFKVIQNPTLEEVKSYYEKVFKPTSDLQHFPLTSFKSIEASLKAFGEKTYLFYILDKTGQIAAAKFFLCSDITCLYSNGGTTALGRKSKGGYLLVLEIIKYLKESGYDFIDWEGIEDKRFKMFAKKWGGFSAFKYKFGGERVYYPGPYIRIFNPFFAALSKYISFDF